MEKRRRNLSPLVQALALVLGSTAFAQTGGDTSTKFWPELNLYKRLNSHARLLFFSRYSTGSPNTFAAGGYVDIFLPRFKPVLFRRISLLDDSRAKRITIRAGYRYVTTPKTTEHRLQTDITLRWVFKNQILFSNRNRFDYRFINGRYSWRYRNQPTLEHDIRAGRYVVTPYIAAELFYDSRYGTLSRWLYTGGSIITLSRHWVVDPYYSRQITKHPSLGFTNVIGMKISFFGP